MRAEKSTRDDPGEAERWTGTGTIAGGWCEAVDWLTTPASLDASLFEVMALASGETVGMGRLVGDGVKDFYVQDVAVPPAPAYVGLIATESALPLYRRNGSGTEGLKGRARLVDPAGDAEHEP